MQDGRRVIHADLEVEDSLPIHGALEISNTGTKTSDNDYRIRATLQHLNLTKHYDVLTADWITSWDFDEVNAWAGGYYLPIGDLYSLSLFGGYSTSRMDDILPLLDIHGKGHFFGGQITRTMRDTPKYRLQLSGGWVFQHSETEHELANMSLQQRDIDMSMPQFTVGYAAKNFDKFGGRNFLSNTLIANFAGQFGSSESDEFNAGSTAYADGDFLINRVQIARLQRFFSGDDAPGKWTLFMKADGQFTSDTLPPDMRKVAGGANTVRGYEESEVAGDQVIAGTLELRTPLFHNFIPGLKKSDEFLDANPNAWQRHRLQFIAFTDFAYVDINNPRAGEFSTEHLLSAGLGFRLGLTKYSQARVDYGYPFEDASDDTPSSGRFHLSLQLQF
jgi:hemolysin activation/secretion protein